MSKRYTITIEELAPVLGVDVDTVRRWIRAGKLETTKPGKRVLVFWRSVEALLAKNKQEAS